MAWEFKREESQGFETKIPEGEHRVRIKSAEKAISKSGRDMLVLQFEVSGYDAIIYHYIVFLDDKPEMTNRMLTQFFDSFKDIAEGDFNMANWIGKVGAAKIKHEEYNGNINPKIHYFINASKQAELPPWQDGPSVQAQKDGFVSIPDALEEDLPF